MKNIIGSVVLCLITSASFAVTPVQQQNTETSSPTVNTMSSNKEPHTTNQQSSDRKDDVNEYKNDHKMNNNHSKEKKGVSRTSVEDIEKKDSMNHLNK